MTQKKMNLPTVTLPGVLATAPAASTLPARPAAWAPPAKGMAVRTRVMAAQKKVAVTASQEIAGSTRYPAMFGEYAPNQAEFAQALGAAGQWSADIAQLRAWMQYALEEEGIAWTRTTPMLDALEPIFKLAVARDPSVATAFPSVARYYGVKVATAAKVSRTQRAKAKAAKAARAGKETTPAAAPEVTGTAAHATTPSAVTAAPTTGTEVTPPKA